MEWRAEAGSKGTRAGGATGEQSRLVTPDLSKIRRLWKAESPQAIWVDYTVREMERLERTRIQHAFLKCHSYNDSACKSLRLSFSPCMKIPVPLVSITFQPLLASDLTRCCFFTCDNNLRKSVWVEAGSRYPWLQKRMLRGKMGGRQRKAMPASLAYAWAAFPCKTDTNLRT